MLEKLSNTSSDSSQKWTLDDLLRELNEENREDNKELDHTRRNREFGEKALSVAKTENEQEDTEKYNTRVRRANLLRQKRLEREQQANADSEEITLSANEEGETDKSSERESIKKALRLAYFADLKEQMRLQRNLADQRLGKSLQKSEEVSLMRDRDISRNPTNETSVKLDQEIDEIDETSENLSEESPRAFIAKKYFDLERLLREKKEGRIMTTEYVEAQKKEVRASVDAGEPVFIHGHLGGGKTELAITVATEASVERIAREQADAEFDKFIEEHPDATADELEIEQGRIFRKIVSHLQSVVAGKVSPKEGEEAVAEKCRPLIISGSRDIEESDLYVDKGLKLVQPFGGKEMEGVTEDYNKELESYLARFDFSGLSEDEAREERNRKTAEFLKLYTSKNSAFGTEVEKVANAVYQAMKEGRPVIIDEANSIPAGVLISLNNILNKRPGDTCYVPGASEKGGQVKIQEGFSVIMTGNLSTSSVEYSGVDSDLNPATKSRIKFLKYDYLPQSEEGNLGERDNPEKDELFQILIAYLANERGTLELVGGDDTLEKLYSLAQLARTTQMLFSGQKSESKQFSSESGEAADQPELKCPPISIRGLLKIIDAWKSDTNETKTLDEALYRGYLSSIDNAEDQRIVIQQASALGFFSENGWSIEKTSRDGEAMLIGRIDELFDKDDKPQKMDESDITYYTVGDVIHLIYGEGPEDDDLLEKAFEMAIAASGDSDDSDENSDEIEMDDSEYIEKAESLQPRLEEIGKAIEALKILSEECGCNIQQ